LKTYLAVVADVVYAADDGPKSAEKRCLEYYEDTHLQHLPMKNDDR
jgi:hypothetical protein